MKLKTLTIALVLAMLVSTFIVAPVSADPDGASDQAGFMYFEIRLGG